MKHIIKSPEPDFFIAWKKRRSTRKWKRLKNPTKSRLRTSIVKEQGYICCYCMREIPDNHTITIEHFYPKDPRKGYAHKVFDYQNLMAACHGGRKDPPPRVLHCDAIKSNFLPPPISPLDKNCQEFFGYTFTGRIVAQDQNPEAKATIRLLNLNSPRLVQQRRAAIETWLEELHEESNIEEEIEILEEKYKEKFIPFCTAIIYVLRHLED